MSKIYRHEGKIEEARQALQTILEKHAGTKWARPAEQLLSALPE
jgi:hypothetical protein